MPANTSPEPAVASQGGAVVLIARDGEPVYRRAAGLAMLWVTHSQAQAARMGSTRGWRCLWLQDGRLSPMEAAQSTR